MIEQLYLLDKTLLYFFNHTLSAPFLDKFFSTITNVNNWFIAYIILFFISTIKGGRKGRITAIGVIILILITDQISHNLIKEWIHRIRPCNILPDVLTPLGCTGSYSFPSNHAVNNFAAAAFIFRFYKNLKWALFIPAFLVTISRVYLGLHYPSDAFGGAIIGFAAGYAFSSLIIFAEDKLLKKKLKEEKHGKRGQISNQGSNA